jgi:hypothetical protein
MLGLPIGLSVAVAGRKEAERLRPVPLTVALGALRKFNMLNW